MTDITKDEIVDLMLHRNLTAERFIDTIIDANALIGVGLVSLAQFFYYYTLLNKEIRHMTKEEALQFIINYKKKHGV